MPETPDGTGQPSITSATLAVTPERLHQLAVEFRTSSESLSGRLTTLGRVAESLSGSWSGISHDTFVHLWDRSHTTIGDLCQAMYQVADALDTAANSYSHTEQQNAQGT